MVALSLPKVDFVRTSRRKLYCLHEEGAEPRTR